MWLQRSCPAVQQKTLKKLFLKYFLTVTVHSVYYDYHPWHVVQYQLCHVSFTPCFHTQPWIIHAYSYSHSHTALLLLICGSSSLQAVPLTNQKLSYPPWPHPTSPQLCGGACDRNQGGADVQYMTTCMSG